MKAFPYDAKMASGISTSDNHTDTLPDFRHGSTALATTSFTLVGNEADLAKGISARRAPRAAQHGGRGPQWVEVKV
jgi:hypothetical protein